MALHTLGTTGSTVLNAVTFNPPQAVGQGAASSILSPADLAAIAAGIMGDGRFAASKPTAVLATGSTHSNTALDTLVAVAGPGLAAIAVGFFVLGVGIVPGTIVIAKPTPTSVTLSQAATATANNVRVGFAPPSAQGGRFSFNGQVEIPGRGILMVKPGDVVAIDNTGWPILVSAAAIAYPGSLWSFV